ncbi:MAG TPA: SDR family oxidoreductase, partial [Herpetosiphonaceae bacterium]|nr:SDR family oxidoreductase [Herpetosiphonaceae bacterium]
RREDLTGRFLDTSRAGWATAMDISVYSLVALTRAALPHFNPGATVLTLSYYGAEKVIPNYNVMGVAKSALESTVRYLAADLGPDGFRVNAISAGPIRTLSAAGIGNFRKLHRNFAETAPLRRNVTIEDVGNSALWLCSDLSSGVTGEVVYVDAGYNILGMGEGEKEGA